MSLAPVPSDQPDATCANCGAALVADQRYCLSCGQPVVAVRLAFLDVLAPAAPAPTGSAPAAWAPPGTIEVDARRATSRCSRRAARTPGCAAIRAFSG